MLSEEQVTQFQAMYKKRFWKEISKQKAIKSWMQLLVLMGNIYKPIRQPQAPSEQA